MNSIKKAGVVIAAIFLIFLSACKDSDNADSTSHGISGGSGHDIRLGMYYFGKWTPEPVSFARARSATWDHSWDQIKPYAPEREPLPVVGWYDSRDVAPMEQHLRWMADHGIDFLTMAWYWVPGGDQKIENQRKENPAVYAYLEAKNRSRVSYSLMWCNHFPNISTLAEWDQMVDYWIDNHFNNREYFKIDNKPVLFIFTPESSSTQGFKHQVDELGVSGAQFLDRARERVKLKTNNKLDGIYFVLCVEATDYWVPYASTSGFNAISGYFYHHGVAGHVCVLSPCPCYSGTTLTEMSQSFAEVKRYYEMQWDWILANKNSNMPYFVPMTAGWDNRPWGSNTLHDNSKATPSEFEEHLLAGYDRISQNMDKTAGIGMLHAWNEFGEGAIIEPTARYQFEFLQRVRKVFR